MCSMGNPDAPLVSVIVPVYNVEPWLEECLQSIAAQTLEDFEVIVVDDGSTDASGRIADRFSSEDVRFTVIHQANGGVSSARNAGIDIAKGKYLSFVDSDDYLEPTMLEKLVHAAEEQGTAIAMCDYAEGDGSTWKRLDIFKDVREEVLDEHRFWLGCYGVNPGAYIYIWNKLFRSDAFSSVRFAEGFICEDQIIALDLYHGKASIAIVRDALYSYRIRKSGNSRAGYLNPRFLESIVLSAKSFIIRDMFFSSRGWTDVRMRNLRKTVAYLIILFNGKEKASQEVLDAYAGLRREAAQICRQILPSLLARPKRSARVMAFLLNERLYVGLSKLRKS